MTERNVRHHFELDLEIAGTPEDVWHAIATAGGISSWMTPAEIDSRPGGDVVFHMGPGVESRGKVTAVEPLRRIVYEEDWATLAGQPGDDVTPLVTEFLVEARSGGTCSVRIVTSAFGVGADWENEFFTEMEVGWAPMLDNLRLYVEAFPGQTATTMSVSSEISVTPEDAIGAVREQIGVAAIGETAEVRDMAVHVERSIPLSLVVRSTAPVSGLFSFFAFGNAMMLTAYLFGANASSYIEGQEAEWQAWLDDVARSATGRVGSA